ncbi:hypothetical protein P4O66_022447, partial [Electrophorus voltai]
GTGGQGLPETMDGKPSFHSSDLGQQQAVMVMSPGSWVEPAGAREECGAGHTQGEEHVARAIWKAPKEQRQVGDEEQGGCPTALGKEALQEPVGEDQQERRKEVEKAPKRRWDALGMSRKQVIRADGAAPGSICLAEHSLSRRVEMKQQVQPPQRQRNKGPKEPRGPGPFFFFGGRNGASIVVQYCESQGWQRIYDKTREDYKLKWCELKSSHNYYNFREGEQLVYQIPNNKVLTTKIGLLNSLREYDRVRSKVDHGQELRRLKIEDFFPDTFRMDVKDEREVFFAQQEGFCPGKGNMWICKPTGLNQGRGIFLLQTPEDITAFRARIQNIADSLTNRKIPSCMQQAQIVQRYIQNPLLLNGKKFDVRSYFLIACTSPYMVFFRHGYVRLTCDLYDPNSNNLSAHLTNQYMQKKNPLYSMLKEETVWSMEHFNLYVNETFMAPKRLPRDWVWSVFAVSSLFFGTKRMQQIMTQCFLAVKAKLECKLGYFDLIGCDFLIDENFKVWLLEMNCNPALHTNCEVLEEVVPRTVTETLDLALEIFNKCHCGLKLLPLSSQREFQLLYCAESKNESISSHRSRTAWPRGTACPKTMAPHSVVKRSTVGAKSTATTDRPPHRPAPLTSASLFCSSPPAAKPSESRQNLTNEHNASISTTEIPANHTAPFAAGPSLASSSGPPLPGVSVGAHAQQLVVPFPRQGSGTEVVTHNNPSTKASEMSRCRANKGGPGRVELRLSKCTWPQPGLTSDLRVRPELATLKSTITSHFQSCTE